MKYRVWHIPQVPGPTFYVEADTLAAARDIQDTLAEYDLFQFESRIKPDFANASGIERRARDEWVEVDEDLEDLVFVCYLTSQADDVALPLPFGA